VPKNPVEEVKDEEKQGEEDGVKGRMMRHKEELSGVHNCKELHIFHASSRKSHVRPGLQSTQKGQKAGCPGRQGPSWCR
jgi:hypothetical protein